MISYISVASTSTEKDVLVRIAKAWSALNRLRVIWKSALPDKIKINFFRAVVETVLLYGSPAWTLTKKLEKKLDGTYTRMLRAVLNVHWKTHPSNKCLYGNLSKISLVIKDRRMRFAGHCYRSKEEVISELMLWKPTHGTVKPGRPFKTYTKQLTEDCEYHFEDLHNAMSDREVWRSRVNMVRETNPI